MPIAEPRSRKNPISLTPLIDIVFILLVFFMLASSFMRWQVLELGVSETEAATTDSERQTVIVIDGDGEYLLNKEPRSLDDVVAYVRERLREDAGHAVLVQPAADLPLQSLVRVLDTLQRLAGAHVALLREDSH